MDEDRGEDMHSELELSGEVMKQEKERDRGGGDGGLGGGKRSRNLEGKKTVRRSGCRLL